MGETWPGFSADNSSNSQLKFHTNILSLDFISQKYSQFRVHTNILSLDFISQKYSQFKFLRNILSLDFISQKYSQFKLHTNILRLNVLDQRAFKPLFIRPEVPKLIWAQRALWSSSSSYLKYENCPTMSKCHKNQQHGFYLPNIDCVVNRDWKAKTFDTNPDEICWEVCLLCCCQKDNWMV